MNKIEDVQIREILHDYRSDIVKGDQENVDKWKKWDNWNILQKTLEYELDEKMSHVESNLDVKKLAFSRYCSNYKEEYATADIMNGWWYCFKELFNHEITSRQNDKDKVNSFLKDLKGEENEKLVNSISNNLKIEYKVRNDKEKICEAFIRFLKVVYTIGNMTPAPKNPSQGLGLDTWEYKLDTYKEMYHDYEGDKEKLRFQDYYNQNVIKPAWTTKKFHEDPAGYMNSRTELILKRAYRIIVGNQEIPKDILKELEYELNNI